MNGPLATAKRPVRVAWVAVAALAAHMSALRGGLVWLDHAHLSTGYAVRPPAEWWRLFTEPFARTGFYRPITALSLSLDALLGSTAWFHAENLLWHAAAAVATLAAARALGLSRGSATVAALLFAVHPLGSLVASAIAFRSEAMITVALLGLVVAHRRGRPVWAAAAVLLGALTKETAFALAPLFVIALELRYKRLDKALLGAEAAALSAAGVLRLLYAPTWLATFPQLTPSEAVGTRLATLPKSALAFVAPVSNDICDAFPVTSVWAPMALFGLLIAVGLVWLVAQKGLVALLMTLALLPSLQLVPTLRWWSPHYLYVACAFACMLVARALARHAKVVLVVVVALAAMSWRDGRRYQSDVALWRPEVDAEPACREAHFYLGESAREARDFSSAAREYEAAITPRPGVLAYVDLNAALQNLGVSRLELSEWDRAADAFEAALEVSRRPDIKMELTHDLALARLKGGHPAEAVRLLEPVVAGGGVPPATRRLYDDARQAVRDGADLVAPAHE